MAKGGLEPLQPPPAAPLSVDTVYRFPR